MDLVDLVRAAGGDLPEPVAPDPVADQALADQNPEPARHPAVAVPAWARPLTGPAQVAIRLDVAPRQAVTDDFEYLGEEEMRWRSVGWAGRVMGGGGGT